MTSHMKMMPQIIDASFDAVAATVSGSDRSSMMILGDDPGEAYPDPTTSMLPLVLQKPF